jgi:Rod binding domain-containing protein
MSALSAAVGSPSLATGALPAIDQATEPASVRNGDQAAKNAYQTGLAFEQMLDNELTQTLSSTISGTGSSDDGLGGTTDQSDGSANPEAGAFSSMLPDALTSGLMSGGGTGVAMQIAQGIDPALNGAGAATSSLIPGTTGSGVTTPSGGTGLTTAGDSGATASSGATVPTTASEVGV